MNDRPVLVTGASGFVGRYLLEELRTAHGAVVGWSRAPVAADLAGAAVWQCVDLTKREQVRSALRDLRPRQVYHLAGATHVPRSWARPAETLEANVLATHHLLDGLGRAGVRARVLISGSATVYAPSTIPLVRANRLRAIAVTTAKRSPALPDLPTIAETVPGYEVELWYGVLGPKGLPKNIVERWNAEIRKATKLPDLKERLIAEGFDIDDSPPSVFQAKLKSDVEKWQRVVKEAKVKPQ